MSASLSPHSNPTPSGHEGDRGDDKSPLSSLNLNFLKSLNDKKTTRDGNPPKRRGPKPDSKPALTRRQELNRQAQRTHRERKELYIKALEDEVLRLKEMYSNISRDKERLANENQQLKAMMAQHGLTPGAGLGASAGIGGMLDDAISNPSLGYPSSNTSYPPAPSSNASAFTSPPMSASGGHNMSPSHNSPYRQPQQHGHPSVSPGASAGRPSNRSASIDYEQAGIDFVLTLEKPCMDHLPWLLERGLQPGGHNGPCGHALMASCPPEPFSQLTADVPFGYSHSNGHTHGNGHTIQPPVADGPRTWELSKGDLATLLDLSKRLDLDGEITPVMAWGMILGHGRLGELRAPDFVRIADELGTKIRCYGFGAVMEEFEVRDAMENVLAGKDAMFYR